MTSILIPPLAPLTHEPSARLVLDFYAALTSRFRARIISKPTSALMAVAARALDLMGVVDHARFLSQYTTTIGHDIYTPYTPGLATPEWCLWEQMTTLVHECQHVRQFERSGAATFAWGYLTSQAARASYEIDAYTTELEMSWWRYKRLPDVRLLASSLLGYGLSAANVTVALKALNMRALSIQRGAVTTEAGHYALDWLQVHAPGMVQG